MYHVAHTYREITGELAFFALNESMKHTMQWI